MHQDDLLESRHLFGDVGQRRFSFLDRLFYMNIKRPGWCDHEDDLWELFHNKWEVIETGIIVWGHIVQANSQLFEPGNSNCPASVVYSPKESSEIDVETLSEVASSMFQLKNTNPEDEDLQELAEYLTDEMTRTFGAKVPRQLSQGHDLRESTTFITRKHLPNKILSNSFFPLVVYPKEPYYCLPLPSRYWSKNLIELWCYR